MNVSFDIDGRPSDTRVVVAMSGGVDSSVVAALAARAGYEVVGVTLQLYDHAAATHRKGACCAGQDIHDARRVAERLGIAHYVLDYEARFRESVIETFADSYARGETPVPCIACNQTVKFADLLKTAEMLGAKALATGHYVESRTVAGRRAMFRPVDADRDQSYFLFATTREQLEFIRFPLGRLTKDEVRRIARELALPVAGKSDSQDICFVPDGRYARVVEKLRPEAGREGDIVHVDGRTLGRHRGIMNYTIGQRRGLGIATGEPLFVVAIDAAGNRVVVGPREALAQRRIVLRDLNWIGDLDVDWRGGIEVFARVRSTRPPRPGVLRAVSGVPVLDLAEPEEGVAPGQACALYEGEGRRARVLGGGFIVGEETQRPAPRPARDQVQPAYA